MVAKVPTDRTIDRFVPHGNNLCVQPNKESKTKGGLILPDVLKTSGKTIVATVVKAGPDCKCYRVGDTVVVHAAAPVRQMEFGYDEDEKFCLIEEDKVLGKLDDAAE